MKEISIMDEKKIQTAMSIILLAGDARNECMQSLDAVAKLDFEEADNLISNAKTKITEAHKLQTEEIQEETRGVKSEYSLLFAHAQDTLMTVNTEINLTRKMIKIFEVYGRMIVDLTKEGQDEAD